MELERTIGPLRLRVWILVVNLVANALLLHGAVRYASDGTNLVELVAGATMTSVCIMLLALPSK
ncbi:MAG: hypothetical protein HYX76_11005 [Acidobacteria bacterium]|nr:hypothetical protein [Acidobacteriota bacterium]